MIELMGDNSLLWICGVRDWELAKFHQLKMGGAKNCKYGWSTYGAVRTNIRSFRSSFGITPSLLCLVMDQFGGCFFH